jgi:hypothetical protein
LFSVNDFFKILNFLKGNTVEDLDEVIQILSKSEQAVSTTYFQNIIDQNAHMSPDYLRLRGFLADWYASHKTIVGTQKKVSDVFSLPDAHIDELIRSFGFNGPLDELSRNNKINMFYDLVNLYKIKGTPDSIIKALSYFTFTDIDIVEYWLQKNNAGRIVFAGEYCIPKVSGASYLSIPDVDFEPMTENDPHWMLSEEEVETLVENNKIALPSRTPYFGIVPGIYLQNANLGMAIIVRIVSDDYAEYLATGDLNRIIKLTDTAFIVSFLELYIACVYTFNEYYGRTTGSSGDRHFCYDGAYTTVDDIIDQWNYYNTYRPTIRTATEDERIDKIEEFYALFTRDKSTYFLTDSSTAGTILQTINPDLKTTIDSFFGFGRGFEILSLLMKDLSDYVSTYISSVIPNLSSLVLGLGSLEYVKDIINFFKPYRARFVLITTSYVFNDKLTESIVIGDAPNIDRIQETIIDFDTADSHGGYLEGFFPEGIAVQSDPIPPNEQRIYNIYVDSTTGDVMIDIEVASDSTATQIYSDPPVGSYRVANVYLEDYGYDGMYNIVKKLFVEYYDEPEILSGVATPVYSMPPSEIQFYQTAYLKIDSLGELVITYDETQEFLDWPIDTVYRRYYSRELMDCGSWFDIGASCDFEQEYIPEVIEEFHEYYNIHRYGEDATNVEELVFSSYEVDSTGDIQYAFQSGGFVNFDVGWLFDSPFNNDICYIEVIESGGGEPEPEPPLEEGTMHYGLIYGVYPAQSSMFQTPSPATPMTDQLSLYGALSGFNNIMYTVATVSHYTNPTATRDLTDVMVFSRGTIDYNYSDPSFSNYTVLWENTQLLYINNADIDSQGTNDLLYPSILPISENTFFGGIYKYVRSSYDDTTPYAFYSTDGGLTFNWTQLPSIVGDPNPTGIDYAHGMEAYAASATTWYLFGIGPNDSGINDMRMYKSVDSGSNWTVTSFAPNATSDRYYTLYTSVSGYDSNHIIIAQQYEDVTIGQYGILTFKSTDGGSNWTENIVAAPGYLYGTNCNWWMPTIKWIDANTIYMMARIEYATDGYAKTVFMKSTDAGVTWSAPVVVTNTDEGMDQEGKCTMDIVAGTNGQVIWMGVYEDAYAYDVGTDTYTEAGWYYYRSIDGGTTWELVGGIQNNFDGSNIDQPFYSSDPEYIFPYAGGVYAFKENAVYSSIWDLNAKGTPFFEIYVPDPDNDANVLAWGGYAPFRFLG